MLQQRYGGNPTGAPATPPPSPSGPSASGAGPTPYLARLAQVESRGNPSSPGPGTSDATGLYQFTGPTWSRLAKQYPNLGLTADGRTDPTQQGRAIQAFTGENASALGQAGFQPTPGNLYLAHFAGAGGATAALKADPSTPVEQVLGPQAVAANPFLRGKTAGDLVGWANGKMAGVDPSTVPGAAPTAPPRPQAAAPTAPPPGPTALAAPSPDMPAPNAQPAGSASLPPGITPGMVSAPPQQPRSTSDIVSAAMSKAGYDPADLPAPSAQPTGSAALPPGITPDMISGGSDQAPAPAPDMIAAAMAKAGYPMGGDNPDVPAPGAQDAGSSTLPPGVTPDMISAPSQGDPSALPPLQPVPGPSGPDDPGNATDYALSPSGTRDQFAPSVAIGGLPPADANEGPKPVTFNPAMMGPSTSADANGNQPFNLAPNPNGFTPPQQLPQTGPMPPLGGQSRAAIAAQILQQGQTPTSGDLNPASTPAGVLSAREAGVSLGPPPTQPAIPPNASSLAPPPGPSPMAAAPGQQAISGAMNPGGQAAPSQQALAAALLQRGAGGLAPPSGNSPMSDPSSALNFNRQQMAAQMLANPSGAPAPAAPQGAPMVGPGPGPTPGPAGGPSPQALANGLAPGSAPPPPQPAPMNAGPQPQPQPGAPPQGASPALGQAGPQSGGFLSSIFGGSQPQPAPATSIPTNPADLQALYAKVASDPRTSPQTLAQLQTMMTPQFHYEKMDDGAIVKVDDRGIVPPQKVYQGQVKHIDATRNGALYDQFGSAGGGVGGIGGPGGTGGFRAASDAERAQYGVAAGTPFYFGPDGKPDIGTPQAQAQGESAEAKTAGEQAGQRRGEMLTAADQAPEKMARLQLLSKVLQSTQTGPLSEDIGNASAIAQQLGISNDRLKELGVDPNQAVNNPGRRKAGGRADGRIDRGQEWRLPGVEFLYRRAAVHRKDVPNDRKPARLEPSRDRRPYGAGATEPPDRRRVVRLQGAAAGRRQDAGIRGLRGPVPATARAGQHLRSDHREISGRRVHAAGSAARGRPKPAAGCPTVRTAGGGCPAFSRTGPRSDARTGSGIAARNRLPDARRQNEGALIWPMIPGLSSPMHRRPIPRLHLPFRQRPRRQTLGPSSPMRRHLSR